MHGGSFVYDPWVLYQQGLLNDANMLVIGRPGHGKSALIKSWMYRSRVFGRICELIDPKGEYATLVEALGGEVLTFTPGGQTRLNPLTRLGSREMREGLLEAIARAMLDRPLTQPEALGLSAALPPPTSTPTAGEVCIPDVAAQLREPTAAMADQLACSTKDAQADLRECALALQRLTHGPLAACSTSPRGSEHVWDAPALCLDLSHVGVGQGQSNLAVAIVMVCASAFLDAKRRERANAARAAGREPDKTTRGNDECWRGLPIAGLAEYYQSAFKLSRDSGVQHILALHRLSDLRSAGDDGSRQQRLAQGLLAEASTTVVYRQHAQEVPDTADALGLSSTARDRIAHLPPGVACGASAAAASRSATSSPTSNVALIDTDQAMGSRYAEEPATDVDDDEYSFPQEYRYERARTARDGPGLGDRRDRDRSCRSTIIWLASLTGGFVATGRPVSLSLGGALAVGRQSPAHLASPAAAWPAGAGMICPDVLVLDRSSCCARRWCSRPSP
jgi:hypothetical protein